MPINSGNQTVYGIAINKESPPVIIGSVIPSRKSAEDQLTIDQAEFDKEQLHIVEIKPGHEYTIADMSISELH